ncbi:TonB-dependent receptor [Fulvivirgaceae bacterium BMA10]|uniref:TonB-dependent receptor n=1 Tax=Splendidivirga corallicola TaxID=3051826 RepID=A0ABT8KU64_9BACT|nr:TonB-dependent receptor [Fulvivirgaceae bacterium BMA10]
MTLNRFFITYFLCFIFNFSIEAQEKNGKEPLKEVLKVLELRYQIAFTYADENIENLFIQIPDSSLKLKEVLSYLQQNTNLVFQKLDDRFVTISKSRNKTFSICGFLIDRESKKGIPGASIKVDEKFAISNDDGYFELHDLTKENTLTIRSLGFEELMLRGSDFEADPCKKILLRPSVAELKEVIIENFITQGISKKLDGSFQINTAQLGILPGLIEQDVLQTIQALPGIQSINERVSDINVRGGTNDQNLLLWDGIRMYQSGHFFGLISAFNPHLTEKVSLIKNGTSASLNEGVSSTIDIHSNDKIADSLNIGIGINLINADLFMKIPLSKKISIELSARRSIADIVQTPTYDQYFDRAFRDTEVTSSVDTDNGLIDTNEEFNFHDFSFKLLHHISDRDKLRINFINIENRIEFEENAEVDNMLEFRTSSLKQKNLASGISYSRTWNESFKTNVLLYLSTYDLSAVNFDILNDQKLIQENEVLDTGIKLNAAFTLSDNLSVSGGYQFFEVGVGNTEDINNPRFRRFIKDVVRTHAVYSEWDLSSNSRRSNLKLGVRANYFKKFETFRLEPRLNFSYLISDRFSLEVLGEMKTQTSTQVIDLQNDFLGIEKRRWRLANEEDVPLVTSQQLSAGFQYEFNDLLISFDAYLKEVEGITTASQGFQNQFQFVRTAGGYTAKGIDFLINKKFQRLNAWLSYSYAKNAFTFNDLVPPEFPNNLDITHSVDLAGSYQIGQFQISTGLKWHAGAPFTPPVEGSEITDNKINYDSPNAQRLEDYLRWDISTRYQMMIKNGVRVEFGASIWNVLDRENTVNQYYTIDSENQIEIVKQNSLGLTPNISMRLNF